MDQQLDNLADEILRQGEIGDAEARAEAIAGRLLELMKHRTKNAAEIEKLTAEHESAMAAIPPRPAPQAPQLDIQKINSLTAALEVLLKNPRQNEAAIKHLSAELDAVLPRG
jgi:hypothetical protein